MGEPWRVLLDRMVDDLVAKGFILTPEVERAFRRVPRHLFLPGVDVRRVYAGRVIPTKARGGETLSSSSEPAVMALMIEALDVRPGDAVLEIGAGTGYNAAVLRELAGPDGRVVTIDIDDDLVETARRHLVEAGYDDVEVACGDGAFGYAEKAPYDRIILTAGAYDLSPAWREQLRQGGRLCLPLWLRGMQYICTFTRQGEGFLSRSFFRGGFIRLRGAMGGRETVLGIGSDWVVCADLPLSDGEAGALGALLGRRPSHSEEIKDFERGDWPALLLYAASRDARTVALRRSDRGANPLLEGIGLFDPKQKGIAVLAWVEARVGRGMPLLLAYGKGGCLLLEEMKGFLETFRNGADRGLVIEARPAGGCPEEPGVIRRPSYDLIVRAG